MSDPLLVRPTSIEIKNFRGQKDCSVPLGDLTVLFGVNGSGKTSILDAIAFPLASVLERFTGQRSIGFFAGDVHLEPNSGTKAFPTQIKLGGDLLGQRSLTLLVRSDAELSPDINGHQRWLPTERVIDHLVVPLMHERSAANETLPIIARFASNRSFQRSPGQPTRAWTETLNKPTLRIDGYRECLSIGMDPYAYVSFFARESLVEQRRKSDGLSAVRAAMANVYPGCRRIEFDVDQADLVVDLGGGALPFGQLSDGQRSLVGFVLSLAIRAFQLNPQLGPDAPTQTPGLVLIDEIDLHLHPTWQRDILSGLQRAFPHMSFIVTTHSPIVLTEVAASSIVDLDQLTSSTTSHAESLKVSTLGKQAGWVLDHVMGAENRSAEITEKLNLLDRLIADASLDAAEALLLELRQILDDDEPALVGPTWELADAKQHAQNR